MNIRFRESLLYDRYYVTRLSTVVIRRTPNVHVTKALRRLICLREKEVNCACGLRYLCKIGLQSVIDEARRKHARKEGLYLPIFASCDPPSCLENKLSLPLERRSQCRSPSPSSPFPSTTTRSSRFASIPTSSTIKR